MPALNIRLPNDLHHALKQLATEHRRSLNSEIVVLLEHAVATSNPTPDDDS